MKILYLQFLNLPSLYGAQPEIHLPLWSGLLRGTVFCLQVCRRHLKNKIPSPAHPAARHQEECCGAFIMTGSVKACFGKGSTCGAKEQRIILLQTGSAHGTERHIKPSKHDAITSFLLKIAPIKNYPLPNLINDNEHYFDILHSLNSPISLISIS
jgi:hypothetical protein